MNEELEKLLEKGLVKRGSDESFAFQRIPFGIPVLDRLLGGGIPKKRITILTGQANAGKSYLASQIVVSAQRSGGTAAWIDTELSWDSGWMSRCGVDTDNILVSQPETGEGAFGLVKAFMNASVDVIILDSLAGLVPSNVQEEDFSYNPVAWQARMINSAFPRIMPFLKYGSALVMINQVRSSIGPVSLDNMPGGLAQTFFSHFILQVRRQGWVEENKTRVGFDIEIRCRKSKVGGLPFQSCVVPFRLEGGIDLVETGIREALSKGKIIQSGAWYKVGDAKVMGLNGLKKYFLEHQGLLEQLVASS